MSDSGKNSVREAEVDERQFFALSDYARAKPIEVREETAPSLQNDEPAKPLASDVFERSARRLPLKDRLSFEKFWFFARSQLSIEQSLGTPFLLIPVIMIAGVTNYFTLSLEPAAHNIPIALVALLSIRAMTRKLGSIAKYVLNTMIIFVLAMGLAQWRTMSVDTAMLGSEVSTNLTAQIRAIEQRPNGSVRYTLDVITTERPKLRYAPHRVRATTKKPVLGAVLGQGLRGYLRLRPPSGPVRPNGFDFAFNNYFQKIGANGFFLGQPKAFALTENNSNPRILIERSRLWLAKHIRNQNPSSSGAVAVALITGHKAAIPEQINESLRISGLAHLLSISGLHMALVAGTVMFAYRLAFAAAPSISSHVSTKKCAAVAGFSAIFIYLFMAGASVATQRSFIMLAIMLGALLSDRSAITLRNLALAAIFVVLISPEAALGPSFQMSFAATLALIAAYAAWNRWRASKSQFQRDQSSIARTLVGQLARFFATLALTSIIAGTATGIFAAYHFNRVAVLGLLGNLLAMPIASIITMPSAILATLLIPVGLDGYAFTIMDWSINQIIKISDYVAQLSPSGAIGALSPKTLLWMASGLIVLCVLQSKLKYFGLFAILPAFWTHQHQSMPLMVISEDSRQLALFRHDGALVVNRKRPSSFAIKQWQAAYKSSHLIKLGEPNGFDCHDAGYCTFVDETDRSGISILYIEKRGKKPASEYDICTQFDIIVLAYSPSKNPCEKTAQDVKSPLVITQQQLALYGSAEIHTDPDQKKSFVAHFALGEASRPWHAHRKFSRPARNLGPIQRSSQ